MKTHADLAARLLREAATIFRSMSKSDPELGASMSEFATWYDRIADLVEADPTGELQLASDAAT